MHLSPPLRLDVASAPEDAYGLAAVTQAVLDSSEISKLRFQNVPKDIAIEWYRKGHLKKIEARLNGPRIGDRAPGEARTDGKGIELFEHLVIRDLDLPSLSRGGFGKPVLGSGTQQGMIVSHAEWTLRPKEWWERFQAEEKGFGLLPPTANKELIELFNNKISEAWRGNMEGKEHYVLEEIATMPSYGGRGLAKALVSWIFPYADAENRLCFLVASPMGYPVYKKLGFQEIGGPHAVAEIDRSKWGGQGIHRHITMIRYPQGHGIGRHHEAATDV